MPDDSNGSPAAPDPASGSVHDDLDDRLDAIHANLAATQELPVERGAARWIGEAEAVAQDLAEVDLDSAVVAERLGHVQSLLAEVESTGDDTADEHLRQATSLTTSALEALDSD